MKKLKLSNGAATNSILLTMIQVVTTVLGLIVTKLLSVNFSLHEYGTYSQALLVTTTATSVSIFGLTNATNYFFNKTPDVNRQKEYISTIFSIQYIVGSICAAIIILFRTLIAGYFDNEALNYILLIQAFEPLLTNLISMYQNLFVSIGEAKKIAARNLIVSIVRLIAVVLACFVTNDIVTVLVFILDLDIAQVAYFATMFSRDKFVIRIRNANFGLTKEILGFSIPMAIYVLTNSLNRDLDKYVVSAFSDTETLAIYTNAAKVLPFDMLTSSLITVLVPIITRQINQQEYDKAKDVFKLYLRIGYILTCIFVGGAIAVARHLMLFLYDDKYISGIPIFIIYLFVDMIRFANVTTILSGAGKSRILMVISLIELAANGVFNIAGYKLIGITGPAIVTLILTFLMTLALLHFGAKEIKSSIIHLFNLKEIAIVGSEIIIFGIGTHFLANFLRDSVGMPLFFVLAISYGCYLIVMFGLNYKRVLGVFRRLNTYK